MEENEYKNHTEERTELQNLKLNKIFDPYQAGIDKKKALMIIEVCKIENVSTIEINWRTLKKNNMGAIQKVLEKKTININKKFTTKTPWFTVDFKQKCEKGDDSFYLENNNYK